LLSTECRFGIAYRCVSANRIEPCSSSLHRGPASGNLLAASYYGTRSRSTSAQPTCWNDRNSSALLADGLLRGAPLVHRIHLFRGYPQHGVALGRRICGRGVKVFRRPAGGFSAKRCASTLGRTRLRLLYHGRLHSTMWSRRPASPRIDPPQGLFSRLFHRIAALHPSPCRIASSHRRRYSSNRAAFCFNERRLSMQSSHRWRPLRHKAGSSIPRCDGSATRPAAQNTGRSRVLQRTGRVPFHPIPTAFGRRTCRRDGRRRRIASAVPMISGRARAALMQPRDSVASRNSARRHF
jgi:hypothetical protein